MTPARPLTPPEVRELLALSALRDAELSESAWDGIFHFGYDTCVAVRGDPTLRATLERYAELAEAGDSAIEYQPGRWWRIRKPDGTLWLETSSESEAREEARETGLPLERQWNPVPATATPEWRPA